MLWTLDAAGTTVVQLGSDISTETIDWSQLDNVPTEFPPTSHGHEYAEIDNGKAGLDAKTLDVELDDILTHLANIDSELGALQGNLTFAGTVAMSTGTITSVTTAGRSAGFTTGPIPADPPSGSNNLYFIC